MFGYFVAGTSASVHETRDFLSASSFPSVRANIRQAPGRNLWSTSVYATRSADLPSSLACATEQGRALEDSWRAAQQSSIGSARDELGCFVITSSSPVPVGPSAELSKPPFLAELQEGDVIEVVETRFLVSEHRLRGRLANPNGWISLRNTETGFSWVEHESIFRDFDTNMSRALESLSHETLGSGMEAELREEVRDRLKGDLLYLAALRKQAKSGFSALPSFESRDGKTWALAGPGHDDWRRVAGNTTWEVPCKEVTGQLRRVMLGAVIAERAYALPLVDSYAEQRTVYQACPSLGEGAVVDGMSI